ncbi:MAG: gliding motility-associated C-terminal domain-containing protein [Bacteroidetes bacterium]|nr:gliding motility-associated C-terminal domain-containing protein [Bacteroidota bacterium]
MRFIGIFLVSYSFFFVSAYAVDYNMPTGSTPVTYSTCSGNFYDDGGAAGKYGNNRTNRTITFCPGTPNSIIKITFTFFKLQGNYDDYLEVWSGRNVGNSSNRVAIYTGVINRVFSIVSTSADGCLTFRFNSDASTREDGWKAEIICLNPCISPIASFTTNSSAPICSTNGNLNVSVDASASSAPSASISKYEWDWGNGDLTTTTTPQTTYTYTAPGIYLIRLNVRNNKTDLDPAGCRSTNSATRTVTIINPPDFSGTTSTIINTTCGQSVNLDGVATSTTKVQKPPFIRSQLISLPDGTGVSYISQLDFTGYFPPGAQLGTACYPTVSFELEHSWSADLRIELVSPTGKKAILFNEVYNQGNNSGISVFGSCVNQQDNGVAGCPATYTVVNSGGASWTSSSSVITNSTTTCPSYSGPCDVKSLTGTPYNFFKPQNYTSEQSFSALNGSELNGVWSLVITDTKAEDDGVLKAWNLSFPNSCYATFSSVTPRLNEGKWKHTGSGPAVPANSSTRVVVTDPGPEACPIPGTCSGSKLTNSVPIGPFNDAGDFVYTYGVKDEYGCTYTKDVTVRVNCPVNNCILTLTSPSALTNQSVCVNKPVNPIVYQIGGDATSAVVSGLPSGVTGTLGSSGVFTISGTPTVTGTFNYTISTVGCASNKSLTGTINVDGAPVVVVADVKVCAGVSASVSANVTPATATYSYVWTVPSGATNPGNVKIFNTTVAGDYKVVATNTSTGCVSAQGTGKVSVNARPLVTLTSSGAATECVDSDLTYSTQTGQSNYVWTVSGIINTDYQIVSGGLGSTNAVVRIKWLTPGNKTLTVNYSNIAGCEASSPAVINTTIKPINTASPPTIMPELCNNTLLTVVEHTTTGATNIAALTSALLGLPDGVTATFTGDATAGKITISGTPTTANVFNYAIPLTGGCGGVEARGKITVNPLPSKPVLTHSCAAGSGNVGVLNITNANPNEEYALNGAAYQSLASFSNLANNTYTVVARNIATQCKSIVSLPEVINCGCANAPSISLSSNAGTTCGITPITINGNSFGGSATSVSVTSDGGGILSASSFSTKPFSFTYTPALADAGKTITITLSTNNPLGAPCVAAVDNYTLQVNAPVTPEFPSYGPYCQNDLIIQPILPTTSNNGITGSWSPASISLANAGSIPYTFTPDPGQCVTGPFNTNINVNPTSAPVINCSGTINSVEFSWANVVGALSYDVRYSINGGIPITVNGVSSPYPIPGLNQNDLVKIEVTPVGPAAACLQSSTQSCSAKNCTVPPTGTLSGNTNICINGSTTFSSTVAGGVWSSGNTAVADIDPSTGVITPVSAGTSTISYTVANTTPGCQDGVAPRIVTVKGLVAPQFNTINPVCAGKTIILPGRSLNNITGTWSPVVDNTTTTTYTFTPATGQCATDAALTVVVNTSPAAPVVGPAPLEYCTNQAIGVLPLQATAIAGATLNWYGRNATGGIPAATPPVPATNITGNFSYYVSQVLNGCESPRVSIAVKINPLSNPPQVLQNVFCENELVSGGLNVIGNNLLWYAAPTGGTGSIFQPTVNTQIPGTKTYYVTQQIAGGCESRRVPVVVTVNPLPNISAGEDKKMDQGLSVQLSGEVEGIPATIRWAPSAFLDNANSLTPVASPSVTTQYILTVVSQEGCRVRDTMKVVVLQPLDIPNAFSPNGDGIHDTWVIPNIEQYPDSKLQIFNRYGTVIFEQFGYQNSKAWDGKFKGVECPVGAYYYLLDTGNLSKPLLKGVISIIR